MRICDILIHHMDFLYKQLLRSLCFYVSPVFDFSVSSTWALFFLDLFLRYLPGPFLRVTSSDYVEMCCALNWRIPNLPCCIHLPWAGAGILVVPELLCSVRDQCLFMGIDGHFLVFGYRSQLDAGVQCGAMVRVSVPQLSPCSPSLSLWENGGSVTVTIPSSWRPCSVMILSSLWAGPVCTIEQQSSHPKAACIHLPVTRFLVLFIYLCICLF